MTKRAAALLAAFLCAMIVAAGASAQDFAVSPGDFGIGPAMPAPLPPPAELQGEPTGNFLAEGPFPVAPVIAPAPVYAPIAPAPGTDLQAAAPNLYASLTATVTATTGDPSIPVVVRPATTAQALDAAGIPVNLEGIAAQGHPVVDWNAARAGTPYPVESPGQPGVVTYVVPIQVPVYVNPTQTVSSAQPFEGTQAFEGTPAPVAPVPVPVAQQAATVLPVPPTTFAQAGDPFANIIAVTPGAQHVAPTATAAIAGNGGVYYYGQNPVSIASALGYDTATGMEFLDFGAMPSGAINLVTPAQIKHALLRQTPLVILDVRSDLVRDVDGHIIGDVSVPLQPAETFAARVARAIPEKALPVVVYCEDGFWSSQAADVLLAMGYKTFLMGSYRLWL